MRHRIAIAFLVAACGGGGGSGGVDSGVDAVDGSADARLGVCDGRPCLTSIDDLDDWAAVSVAHAPDARCDFIEETKFLAPATAGAALQDVVFQDVGAHRFHLGFMTQVLTEYFGGLSPATYQQIVQRRATRQYWAGVVYRLADEDGATIGYGFDVVVDPAPDEAITEAEAIALAAQLEAHFHLPLVYAPVGAWAIYLARDYETLVPHFPRACEVITCETPGVDCVEVPAAVPLCGHFWEGRDLEIELVNKTRLVVGPRTIELPRALGTHTVPAIFGAGERGPARTAVLPAGPTARYEVTHSPPAPPMHVYTQDFTVGADAFELRWEIPLPAGGGGFRLTEATVDQRFSAYLAPPGTTTNDDTARLASCSAATLEHWQLVGQIAGGDGFTVDYRYQPPFAGSGPLFLTRGEVRLGSATAIVDDYFRLVYAGEHHNWNNQFWVLFAAPIDYAGHPVHGLCLDEAAFTSELDAAYTLDAQRRPLDRLDVTSYVVDRAP